MANNNQTNQSPVPEERMQVDWLSKENIKKILLIALVIIVMLVTCQNYAAVFGFLAKLWDIFFPFVLGACIAFIVNVPMVQIENKALSKKPFKGKRILAWFLTILLILAIIAGAMFIIIPQIVTTAKSVATDVQKLGSLSDVQTWIVQKFPETEQYFSKLDLSYKALVSKAMNWIQKSGTQMLNSGVTVVSNVVAGVADFFIGFAFSVYILFRKEKLAVQGKKVTYALFSEKTSKRILDVFSLSYRTFSNFIRGQVLEACILGFMFFVAMTIFRMPYAMLCAVLIAITALIPIFGAFIGGGISTLLILVVSPKLALAFMVMFVVLQQMEGKLIYPHVVGSSVGLPGIWVLLAITVGGELMGIAGMLIFVPLCSVLYALFRNFVFARLDKKQVSADKWALNPPKAARGQPIKVNTEKLQQIKERKARSRAAADEAKDSIADAIEDGRDTPEE